VKKLGGRASWRAIASASPCPMRLGGSLALPMSAGFEFFHTFSFQADLQERPLWIASSTASDDNMTG